MTLLGLLTNNFQKNTDGVYYHHDPISEEKIEAFKNEVKPLFNLPIYLCSTNAEYYTKHRPKREVLPNGQAKEAEASSFWKMGFRIGASIRTYQNEQALNKHNVLETGSDGIISQRNTPVLHVCRAHWHSYWVGPHDGKRELVVKWLPPIPVNVQIEDTVPTLHKVR